MLIFFSRRSAQQIQIPLVHGKSRRRAWCQRGEELTALSQRSSAGRDQYAHRIPAIYAKEKGKCQYTYKVCVDRGKCHSGKSTQKYATIYRQSVM
jgi:hypothetical protein